MPAIPLDATDWGGPEYLLLPQMIRTRNAKPQKHGVRNFRKRAKIPHQARVGASPAAQRSMNHSRTSSVVVSALSRNRVLQSVT